MTVRLHRLTTPAEYMPSWGRREYRIAGTRLIAHRESASVWTIMVEIDPDRARSLRWLDDHDLTGRIFRRLSDLKAAVAAEWAISPPPSRPQDVITMDRQPDGSYTMTADDGQLIRVVREPEHACWRIIGPGGDPAGCTAATLPAAQLSALVICQDLAHDRLAAELAEY